MKLMLIDKMDVHISVDEKARTVTAWVDPKQMLFTIWKPVSMPNLSAEECMAFGLMCLIGGLDKTPYKARAVCSPKDKWNPKIGEEIAYLRLCRRYLCLLERMATRGFHDYLTKFSDYDKNYDDITFTLPWGQDRHLLTEQFIDKRLKYLYRQGEKQEKSETIRLKEALACPFCGGRNIKTTQPVNRLSPAVQVSCKSCGANGPMSFCVNDAIRAWNKTRR